MFVPLTPVDFQRRTSRLYARQIGVVDGEKRFNYAEFGERVNRLANALLDLGLQRADRVAFLAYNSHPLLEAYFGVLKAGGILLPLNIRLTAGEVAVILEDAGARFLFVDPDFDPVVDQLLPQLSVQPRIVWLSDRSHYPDTSLRADQHLDLSHPHSLRPLYEDLLAVAAPDEPPSFEFDENDVAELFYTSGTTGKPKGVMLTHRNLYIHALALIATVTTTDSDVQLHTIPLFHVNGWGTPQALTAVGGRHVMLRKFDPVETFRLIETEKVTRFYAVPTMLNALINHPDIGRYDLSSLRFAHIGGAPMAPEMARRAREILDCDVFAGYGLSETSPVLTYAVHKHHLIGEDDDTVIRRKSTAGMPTVGAEVRIVDDEGNELPWDGEHVGEVVARGNGVMGGYWNDPEGSEWALRDGWFHTGDMATIDEEGYVLIVDRKKDIIISGGENISSVEIEKVLFAHPAILEAAVVGVPDETWGEVPKALVVLREGQTASEAEILDFCRSRLAGFKIPKSVEFFDSLPKGGTGKILKAQLREPYWASQPKRVH